MTIKLDTDERAGYDLLCEVIPADLAESVIKCRRKKKAGMNARIAKRLIGEYKAYGNCEEAAEIHITKAWVDFKAAWVKNASRYTDQHHPTPRPAQSANYGRPEPVARPEPETPEQKANREAMARRLREVAQSMRTH